MRISDWSSDVCSSDLVFGTIFTIGSLVIVYDLITLGYRVTAGANAADNAPASAAPAFADPHAAPVGAPATGWGRYLSGYEAGLWLLGMWFFGARSEEHTSELQSLMSNSYACFCLKQKKQNKREY